MEDELKVVHSDAHWSVKFHDIAVGVAAVMFTLVVLYVAFSFKSLGNSITDTNPTVNLYPTSSPCTYPPDCPPDN